MKVQFATNRYGELKRRFADSNENNLTKVLTELELGDKKSSALLREMASLAGHQLSSDTIKSLWRRRLPAPTRSILTAAGRVKTTIVADMADKIIAKFKS